MWQSFDQDRPFLENKYHNSREPFNPLARFNYTGYGCAEATGLDNQAMLEGVEDLYQQIKNLPHPIIKARALAFILANTRIDVNPHDFFICFHSTDRVLSKVIIAKWNSEFSNNIIPEVCRKKDRHIRVGTFNYWLDYDHSVPDWEALFALGFSGILERSRQYAGKRANQGALTPEQEDYYTAIDITYTAMLQFISRLIDYGQNQPATNRKAPMVVRCLETLRQGGPTNTYEALQLIYLYFMISEHVDGIQVRSLGNLDVLLYPYYQRDLANGTFNREQIAELLKYFFMQFSAIGNYWGQPVYFGGTDEKGDSLINELSYLILDVYDQMGIYNPKLQIKLAPNTPVNYVNRALRMIRDGHNSIVFVCEPAMRRAMMAYGDTEEEARTCQITGCYEYGMEAKGTGTGGFHLNMVKPLELALNNGVDPATGEKIGCETGDCADFLTFDDFYRAYLKQLAYINEEGLAIVDEVENFFQYVIPTPMFSGTITHSLEVAKDCFAGGSATNTTTNMLDGTATAADALVAVRQLVYDWQALTIVELRKALANNWQGYEKLRQRIRNDRQKYGNNLDLPDLYANSIASFLALQNNRRPNAAGRGGYYLTSLHCARQFIDLGRKTGATPDGRRSGDEISKNMSPAVGMDYRGATALIQSLTKMDAAMFRGDLPLDVALHPSAVAGEDGLAAMRGLLYTYMNQGGHAIHFNVLDAATLRDAQAHPDQYKNLQIRVCGWNVLFNQMAKEEQDAYIERAEKISD